MADSFSGMEYEPPQSASSFASQVSGQEDFMNPDPQELAKVIQMLMMQQQLPPGTQGGMMGGDAAMSAQQPISEEQKSMILDALMSQGQGY
jgi:hypothetical protein